MWMGVECLFLVDGVWMYISRGDLLLGELSCVVGRIVLPGGLVCISCMSAGAFVVEWCVYECGHRLCSLRMPSAF